MTKSDRWTGPLLLLFSLYVCVESARLGLGGISRPGPGFFPFYAGLVLAFLALAQSLLSLFIDLEKEEAWENWLSILFVVLAMFAFALFLDFLGFLVTAALFLAFLLRGVERRGWLFSLAVALLIALASYLVFGRWLQAQLPSGILGI